MRLLVILTALSAAIAVPLPARSKKRSEGESRALYPRGTFPDDIPSPENASPAALVADSNTGLADNQHQVDSNAISNPNSNNPDLTQSFFDNLNTEWNIHAAIVKNIPHYSVPLGAAYGIWKWIDPTYLGENREEGLIDLRHNNDNF